MEDCNGFEITAFADRKLASTQNPKGGSRCDMLQLVQVINHSHRNIASVGIFNDFLIYQIFNAGISQSLDNTLICCYIFKL